MAKTFQEIMFEVRNDLNLNMDLSNSLSHLNDAFRMFWDSVPWKETLGKMSPFYLIPGWGLYNEPYINKPEDFRDLYSAEIIEINTDGNLSSRPIDVIGNMKPPQHQGQVDALGYSVEYDTFIVDALPSMTLGRVYLAPIYKKDYPYDLTAKKAASETFPFTRSEGLFKVIMGWHLRGSNEKDAQMVARALHGARTAETPGKQTATNPPEGLFSGLGS